MLLVLRRSDVTAVDSAAKETCHRSWRFLVKSSMNRDRQTLCCPLINAYSPRVCFASVVWGRDRQKYDVLFLTCLPLCVLYFLLQNFRWFVLTNCCISFLFFSFFPFPFFSVNYIIWLFLLLLLFLSFLTRNQTISESQVLESPSPIFFIFFSFLIQNWTIFETQVPERPCLPRRWRRREAPRSWAWMPVWSRTSGSGRAKKMLGQYSRSHVDWRLASCSSMRYSAVSSQVLFGPIYFVHVGILTLFHSHWRWVCFLYIFLSLFFIILNFSRLVAKYKSWYFFRAKSMFFHLWMHEDVRE